MNILEMHRLNKVFVSRGLQSSEKVHVLKNIDFSIEEGQMTAIVGESGCGKTTLGKIATGIMEKTDGELLYFGQNIDTASKTEKHEYRRNVQFIQQDSYAALNPMKTIYSSLYAPVRANNRKMTRSQIDIMIKEHLAMVGLTPPDQFMDKYPHQLSGGQRQRILIARVLLLKPKLVVADEPISMIDVSLRLSILDLIIDLNKKFNLSLIYVTHDLSTVKYVIGDGNIAVMYLGEIVEYGKVKEVLENPRHPYTQALISSVPIPNPKIQRSRKPIQLKSMDIPSISKRCNGCSFASRCVYSDEGCESWEPVNAYTDHHVVKCKNEKMIPVFKLTE